VVLEEFSSFVLRYALPLSNLRAALGWILDGSSFSSCFWPDNVVITAVEPLIGFILVF
jgi:hypothetical protein